jgi:type IV secretory pathway VirB2 component (pilin)
MDRTHNLPKAQNNVDDKPADRFVYMAFLFLIPWLPLPLGSNRVWAGSLLTVISLVLVALWCFFWARNHVNIPPTLKKAWPILLLLIISNAWVGYQLSPLGYTLSSADTSHEFTLGWGLISFFSLCLLLNNTKKRIQLTLFILVGSGVFQAIYGSLMTLTGTEYTFLIPKDSYLGVATGTFINRNHLAGYLVVCLSMGIGLMIATLKNSPSGTWRNRLRRWMTALLGGKARLRIGLIIIVIGIVLTHSRMGNTSFFAAMMITGVIALVLSRHATRSTVILLSSLLVIDILIVGTFFGVDKVVDRLEQTSSHRETRDEVDLYSMHLLDKHLIDGTGAGTFYTTFPEYRGGEIRIFYGLNSFDPHAYSLMATLKNIPFNPLGQGMGFGGVLTTGTNFSLEEEISGDSGLAVLLNMMGLLGIVYYYFLMKFKCLIDKDDESSLSRMVGFMLVASVFNSVVQEEGFSPYFLGVVMIFAAISYWKFSIIRARDCNV